MNQIKTVYLSTYSSLFILICEMSIIISLNNSEINSNLDLNCLIVLLIYGIPVALKAKRDLDFPDAIFQVSLILAWLM